MTRKIFVVGNRYSGSKKTSKILRELSAFLEGKKISFEIFDTDKDGDATQTTRRLDQSFTDLIIVGGDGTINEAVNGLQQDIPISIIPSGTGNDFIKNVRIAKKLSDQFDTALNGQINRVDLGKCNDRIFLNGVGIGFDGQIVEDMATKRVSLLKGHAAYYYHVLRILGGYQVKPFEYQVDHEEHKKALILMAIGNGTTFGGGFKLMPDARIDDGVLEVCTIGDLSPINRFLNIHRLSNGSHGSLKMVDFHKAEKITIEANNAIYAHIDGERMGQPPFNIEILPGALQLRTQ